MREIVLDTETTGLSPEEGHRVLEIGAVEIVHQAVTGRVFHTLINPERDIPEDAARVHGHTIAALKDKPVFASIVDEFLAFIGDSALVIHNAEFDMRFVNAELAKLGREPIGMERVVDTLAARAKKAPRTAEQPGRPVRSLSHRSLAAGQARRVARRGNSGRNLLRAHGRPTALARLRGRSRTCRSVRRRPHLPAWASGCAENFRSSARRRALTPNISKVSASDAIWFRYLSRPA